MKNTLFLIVVFFSALVYMGCEEEPMQVAGIDIKFEGIEGSYAWVIETERNDTSVHLDTIEHGLLSKTNGYKFFLMFETDTLNGDYLIFADSIKQVNIISDVEVWMEDGLFRYSFMFNGVPKSSFNEEDHILSIKRQ